MGHSALCLSTHFIDLYDAYRCNCVLTTSSVYTILFGIL